MSEVTGLTGVERYQRIVDAVVGRSILITGAARSGTTLLGKVIASCQNVEYLFEPPMLYALLELRLPPSTFKVLYSTYLFEDFLLDALSGRRMNLNRGDESQIWAVKDSQEVEARLLRSRSRAETFNVAPDYTLAYKLTDAVRTMPLLARLFSAHRFVVSYRPPKDVLRSLYRKEWFHDETLASPLAVGYPWQETTEGKLPVRLATPFWVADRDLWLRSTILERYELYYWYTYEALLRDDVSDLVISYRQLCDHPQETTQRLMGILGLLPGERTQYILDGVRRAYQYPVISRPDVWDDAHTSTSHHCIMGELEQLGEDIGKRALDIFN